MIASRVVKGLYMCMQITFVSMKTPILAHKFLLSKSENRSVEKPAQ